MDDARGPDELVEVARGRSVGGLRERALVLESLGIPFARGEHGGEHVLLVHGRDAERARAELAAFQRENRGWPPPRAAVEVRTDGLGVALAWGVVLAGFYLLQKSHALGIDWTAAGIGDAGVARGDWWRTVTALCLHADVTHLFGNLVFGAMLAAAVSQLLGSGGGLAALVLSGALGNLLTGLLRDPSHTSLGASTAVFGALGTVVACQWRQHARARFSRFQRLMPLAAGLAFLGFLGTSGERTDVAAHLAGFLAGGLLGVIAAATAGPLRRPGVQAALGAGALLLVVGAWLVALP